MTPHIHLYFLEDNGRLRIYFHSFLFGKELEIEHLTTIARKTLTPKCYGIQKVYSTLIFNFGDHHKLFQMPWEIYHDTAVEFIERNGRIIKIEEDDVLRDGGRADQLLTDAAKLVRLVTDRKGARDVEIYASEFKLFSSKGSGFFKLLRKFRKPKVLDGILIYSKIDDETTNGEFHLVNGGVERTINKYVESHGFTNK